jgi:transcriptional regulator with XRE-family HTH domain
MAEKLRINRLKAVLADKDISHKDFARMVKKAPNTITRICNNEQQPSLAVLREMAIALDVDICELLVPTKTKGLRYL